MEDRSILAQQHPKVLEDGVIGCHQCLHLVLRNYPAMTDVSKSMLRDQQLVATLAAIEDTGPTDIQVYTDGSTHEGTTDGGAGIYIKIFIFYIIYKTSAITVRRGTRSHLMSG